MKSLISERELRQLVHNICFGYNELAICGLLHHDIKPQNILLHNGIFKLGDFGLA